MWGEQEMDGALSWAHQPRMDEVTYLAAVGAGHRKRCCRCGSFLHRVGFGAAAAAGVACLLTCMHSPLELQIISEVECVGLALIRCCVWTGHWVGEHSDQRWGVLTVESCTHL